MDGPRKLVSRRQTTEATSKICSQSFDGLSLLIAADDGYHTLLFATLSQAARPFRLQMRHFGTLKCPRGLPSAPLSCVSDPDPVVELAFTHEVSIRTPL